MRGVILVIKAIAVINSQLEPETSIVDALVEWLVSDECLSTGKQSVAWGQLRA